MLLNGIHFCCCNRVTVDVLRQAAKACVQKRHYSRAHMLIVLAVRIAK